MDVTVETVVTVVTVDTVVTVPTVVMVDSVKALAMFSMEIRSRDVAGFNHIGR